MKFSDKLRLLREEKNETINAAAKEIGIGVTTLRNYENVDMDRIPNSYELKKIKKHYGVSYEYLLEDECENRRTNNLSIGKRLQISDKPISKIENVNKLYSKRFNMFIETFEHFDDFIDSYYKLDLYMFDFYILDKFWNMLEEYDIKKYSLEDLLDIFYCLKFDPLNNDFEYYKEETISELKFLYSEYNNEPINKKELESTLYDYIFDMRTLLKKELSYMRHKMQDYLSDYLREKIDKYY